MSMDYNMESMKAALSKGRKRQQYTGASDTGSKPRKRVRRPPKLLAPKGADASRKYF